MSGTQALLAEPNQVLTLAFFFGLIFQAGLATFLLFIKGHGKTIVKDGPRLVLVLFLLFGGLLWAQISFGSLLIPRDAPAVCQGVLIFSTVFDQLARVAMEQFLLWKLLNGSKPSPIGFIMQGVLLIRMVAGGVLVGFTRPAFGPTCIPQTSLLPSPIVVLSLEIIIIVFFVTKAVTLGMFGDLRRKGNVVQKRQSKAFILTTASFILWTATSVIMILGLPGFKIILRLGSAANGLLVLISVVSIFGDALLAPLEELATTPEAQSPFVGPGSATRDISKDVMASGALPAGSSGNRSARNTNQLYPISETPRGSTTARGTSQRMSNKGFVPLDDEAPVNGADVPSSARKAAGNRGSSGIFGAIVAAPMINQRFQPTSTYIPPTRNDSNASAQKRSLFTWSKPTTKASVRSLGISRPIMNEEDDVVDRQFTRMPTIDLATAAQNERERRQAALGKASPLANNPVPSTQWQSLQQDLMKSMPIERKPIKRIQDSVSTSLLAPGMGANSTSTSLSPIGDEVRRRSPRDMSGFDFDLEEKPNTAPIMPRGPPLGLPSNPRAQKTASIKPLEIAAPTVMLMNNIVYENPGMVKTIIRDAASSYQAMARPKTADQSSLASYTTTIKSPNSMIHRPRPYKRTSEKDRALFPVEPKTRHKRSRSLGSAFASQSSIQSSYPSTFAMLPLPSVPRTAADLKKIFPNNTKSMTFDEKVQLLFPAPPISATLQHRRSSVPSVPRVPSEFLSESPRTRSPISHSNRASKRTTIASFAKLSEYSMGMNSPSIPQMKQDALDPRARRNSDVQDISYDESRIFGEWEERVPLGDAQKSLQERSSISATTNTTELSLADDASYWGSIHSKNAPVDLRGARQNARSTFIKAPIKEDVEDTIPVMLDDGNSDYSSYANTLKSIRHWSQEERESVTKMTPDLTQSTFHHRIGDPLPTFSERESQLRSRKMPPPTPLLLHKVTRQANIVIHATEPSPVESPERAIEEIKAQLDRLEVSDRLSYASSQATGTSQLRIQDRFRMLENLEREMQEMEQMKNSVGWGAASASSSVTNSPVPPPRVSLMSRMMSNRLSKRISGHSIGNEGVRSVVPTNGDLSNSPSSQSSDNSRASVWQKRLAEAQVTYLENAPSLLRNSFNFLAMPVLQTASPTPPDSEESGTDYEDGVDDEADVDSPLDAEVTPIPKVMPSLWEPAPRSPCAALGRLWNHPSLKSNEHHKHAELPAKDVRPRSRLQGQSLLILSSKLWSPPTVSQNTRPTHGLWRAKTSRPTSIATRQRISVKPTRKTRRLTILPDIVESPVPVPNKRDTLGIFKFPWGETSDQPIYQPTFIPSVPFSSFTTSSKMAARSLELEPENGEYSSSFFDDYDDEESGDSEAYYDDSEEEDDEFDDNTLLEIADLLRSAEVPSRQSLFSPVAVVEDYSSAVESEYESDMEGSRETVPQSQLRLPIPPLDLSAKSPSSTKIGYVEYNEELFVSPEYDDRLPEVDSPLMVARVRTLDGIYTPASYSGIFNMNKETGFSDVEEIFPKVNHDDELLIIKSPQIPSANAEDEFEPVYEQRQVTETCSSLVMWVKPQTTPHTPSHGLFNAHAHSARRTTDLEPMVGDIYRRPRVLDSSLPKLESRNLWSRSMNTSIQHDWISVSSVRAISPSAYSPSPFSGRMTPSSDVDSIFETASVRSASTKASSLWESINILTPVWWDGRAGPTSLKRAPSNSSSLPIDVKKPASTSNAAIAAREAKLNSTIPKLRRQKSRDLCQKTKEINEMSRRLKTPTTPKFQAHESGSYEDFVDSAALPLPMTSEQHGTLSSQESSASQSREIAKTSDFVDAVTDMPKTVLPMVSKDTWIEELNKKAVIVGPAFVKKTRPTVTEEEWVAALNEAVQAGQLDLPKRPTVTKEEWIATLEKAVKQVHAKKASLKQLWAVSEKATAPSTAQQLWVMPVKRHGVASHEMLKVASITARRALPAENPSYSVLESNELWKPKKISVQETNWLAPHPPVQSAATWSLRQKPASFTLPSASKLWSKSSASMEFNGDSVMTIESAPRKKSSSISPLPLQRLNSTKLFSRGTETATPVNWLQRSASLSIPTKSAMALQSTSNDASDKPTSSRVESPKSGWMLPLHDPRVSRSIAPDQSPWI